MTWVLGLLRLVRRHPLPAVLVALVFVLGIQQLRIRHLQAKARSLGLEKVTLAAQLDRTRELRGKEIAALSAGWGAGHRGFTRLVEQGALEATALSHELKVERVVAAALSIELQGLKATVQTTVTSDPADNVRHAEIDTSTPRYRAKITADLPRAPLQGRIGIDLTLKPIDVGLDLGCHEKNTDGIRPTRAVAIGVEDLTLTFGRIQASADVCNPTPSSRKGGQVPWWTVPAASGITVIACLLFCPKEE